MPLTFHDSPFDVRFEEADIRGFIREGENEYVNELDFYERPHVFLGSVRPRSDGERAQLSVVGYRTGKRLSHGGFFCG